MSFAAALPQMPRKHKRTLRIGAVLAVACYLLLPWRALFASVGLASAASSPSSATRAAPRLPPPASAAVPFAAALEDDVADPDPHPIDGLIRDGQRRWQAKLARQSKTLDQAVAEYRRRYGRPPPKGFDHWYAFAREENNVVLIDEFDPIDEDLALFRLLSSDEFRTRTQQAMLQEIAYGVQLRAGNYTIFRDSNPDEKKRGDVLRAHGFATMLRPNMDRLPDMDFAIIGLAESLVVPPWEKQQAHNLTLVMEDPKPVMTTRNGHAMWYNFANSCHPASPVRQNADDYIWPERSGIRPPRVGVDPDHFFDEYELTPLPGSAAAAAPARADEDGGVQEPETADRPARAKAPRPAGEEPVLDVELALKTPQMTFLEQTEAYFDMCSVTPDRFYEYGAFYSGRPTFTDVYPLLSPGKGQGTMDIRIPANYMYDVKPGYTYGLDEETDQIDLENPLDLPWEDKENLIHWRGSTTGGGNTPRGRWTYYPRHRLVQLAVQESNLSIPLVRRGADGGPYEASLTPVEDLRSVLDFGFTSTKQCSLYPGGCDAMMEAYDFLQPVALDDAFRDKLIFDIDGMGYSARFLALLSSRSAVIKATVYREFHEPWLEPWVHYIPASTHYQELFNIYAYFLGDTTPKGENKLRKIAEDSRYHKFTQLRSVDLEDVYRLALEWARIWYKDYEDMDYHGPN